jgi:hypothetical protein
MKDRRKRQEIGRTRIRTRIHINSRTLINIDVESHTKSSNQKQIIISIALQMLLREKAFGP